MNLVRPLGFAGDYEHTAGICDANKNKQTPLASVLHLGESHQTKGNKTVKT